MTGIYKIADMVVQIDSLYQEVHTMCRDYRCSETPDFLVATTPQDIEEEKRQSEQTRIDEGLPPYAFGDDYLETLAVYRKIATESISRGRLLMHGSCLAVDGKAVIFTARSGTGKSTHVRLWRQLFGERAIMVNDDKPILRIAKEAVYAYGTPWDGKHHLSTNMSAPLHAICILTRSQDNWIRQIQPQEAVHMMLQQIYRPEDPMLVLETLGLIDMIGKHVPFYLLGCNMNPEAAIVASKGMAFDF